MINRHLRFSTNHVFRNSLIVLALEWRLLNGRIERSLSDDLEWTMSCIFKQNRLVWIEFDNRHNTKFFQVTFINDSLSHKSKSKIASGADNEKSGELTLAKSI